MWPFTNAAAPIIARKRAQREDALRQASDFKTAEHEEYLKVDATGIVENIQAGKWTASQVLEAYIARAAQAHTATNCLTEIMFVTARERAHALDQEFAITGKVVGPLHGVPMSFKDQFELKGYDATVGFSQWAGKTSRTNAEAVEVLINAGVVPFVKTNIPQTMLAFECSNPLWGRTTNPHSAAHTCGGSSGGEAALLAAGGSALGFGSDIGGSLRIPTSYCGIYALKPGYGRIPSGGALSSNPGFEAVKTIVGPMGRSVRDLEVASRILFGQPDSLGVVAPVPFKDVSLPKKLKLGFYTDDGFVKASPANERAVLETVAALRREGHECIELDWPFASEPIRVCSSFFSADGYESLLKPLGPDPKDPSLFLTIYPPALPRFLRATLAWVVDTIIGDTQFATLMRGARPKSVAEFYEVTKERNQLTRRLYAEVWNNQEIMGGEGGLDGIIAPVQAMPTIPHGTSQELSPISNATMMYNAVDSPVGVIPVTRVDPTKDALIGDTWPASQTSNGGGGSKLVSRACAKAYDVQAMEGVPVGVQIIGQKWEDEKVLAMMAIIDRALGERGFGPEAGAALNLKVATKSQRESPTPQLLHHVDQSTSPVTSMSIAQDVMR